MSLRCDFGIHDWRATYIRPWGRWSWFIWEVIEECRRCGESRSRHENSKRMAEQIANELDAAHAPDEAGDG